MEQEGCLRPISLSCTATKIALLERKDSLSIYATTWDGKLQCFNYNSKFNNIRQVAKFDLSGLDLVPVLALAISDNKIYFSCDADDGRCEIFEMDIASSERKQTFIGEHSQPINHLMVLEGDRLASFSWDGTCNVWDLRGRANSMIHSHKLQYGGYVTDVKKHGDNIVGIVGREKLFYFNAGEFEREPTYSGLKGVKGKQYLTSIALDPKAERGIKYCLGTVDGRIIRGTYGDEDAGAIWKSHYDTPSKLFFPVSSMAYHPDFEELLFSGGADGKVNFQDVQKSQTYKRELFQDVMPVTHIDVSPDGQYLVLAKGHGWRTDPNLIFNPKEAKLYVYNLVRNDMPPDSCE